MPPKTAGKAENGLKQAKKIRTMRGNIDFGRALGLGRQIGAGIGAQRREQGIRGTHTQHHIYTVRLYSLKTRSVTMFT
ncbi:hypothetical protein AEYBE204_17025 [Asticcacaulis sp. YBE204]|nr:hypothetical protein AEYBE204_17025 [Asticcacaulis sp. YBE204]